MRLVWDSGFRTKLKKYLTKHPALSEKIKTKLELFSHSPFAPELRNHKLSGDLKGLRAIVIEYDSRIIFKPLGNDRALLVSIGSHDEVY